MTKWYACGSLTSELLWWFRVRRFRLRQVVMLFGEIDCREGLLISVQKGRYNDIAEGAAAARLRAVRAAPVFACAD